jgi:type IV fimbrial biogenesis protein FimT
MQSIPRRSSGFTIIELMFTILLAAIILGFAIPSFRTMTASSRLRTQTNDFTVAVNFARSSAITRNVNVTFCRVDAATDDTCAANDAAWQNWIVRTPAEVIRRGSVTGEATIRVASSLADDQLIFGTDGLSRTSGGVVITNSTITLCSTVLSADNTRQITLGSSSRMSVEKSTGTCS